MKKSLYNITQEGLEIYKQVIDQDGELTEDQEKALVINESELQQKGIAYLEIIRQQKSLINDIDNEIKRLQAKKKASQNMTSRLEGNLLLAQETFGDFDLGLTTVTTRKSKSVEVENVNALPSKFKIVKIQERADKKEIKEALERGEKIEGCKIVENKNLRIK